MPEIKKPRGRRGFFVYPIENMMQDLGFKDRRMFERFSVEFPLEYSNFSLIKKGLAQTVDISANGIGLVTNRDLPKDILLDIWLNVPDNGEPLYTRGEVVWSSMLEDNKYMVGVKLEKPNFMGFARVLRLIDTHPNS